MSFEGERFKVHETSEDGTLSLLDNTNEDADIHPNELSGDENGEQSVLASNLEGQKSSFFLTVTTVVKTVIGAGILGIPYAMSKLGFVVGIVVFVIAGMLAQFGSVLLLKAKNLSHHSNYSSIFFEVWRSKVAKGIGSAFIFFNNIGICIAEVIIFKMTLNKIYVDIFGNDDLFISWKWVLVLLLAVFETPLTLVSKMEKLKYMALSGVAGIVIFMISFVAFFLYAVLDENEANNPAYNMKLFPDHQLEALASVPTLLLALNFQMNFFPIFKGMKNVTDKKMSMAALAGIGFCVCSYLLVGLLGYAYAGKEAKANFLTTLDYNKLPHGFFFIINFFFLISIYFAFPIMFFGCRNNFIAIMKLIFLKDEEAAQQQWRRGDEVEEISSYIKTDAKADRKKRAKLHFYGYTAFIYCVIIGIAMGVDDIEPVFNVVGAVCSSSIGLLMPALFYFRLIADKKQPKGLRYYVATTLFTVMIPFALLCIIAQHIK